MNALRTDERDLRTRLTESLRLRGVDGARIAFVLGSGLGAFADNLEDAESISYEDLDGMPMSSVPGHAGRLVLGRVAGVQVVAQQGRVHLYEGWTAQEVTRAVRAFGTLGIGGLVLTNAAGGLQADWPIPALMRITDHLNLQGRTPLSPLEMTVGTPYDADFGSALDAGAAAAGIDLHQGVYGALMGPTYETPAEVRMLRWAGANAVGMSTALEALAGSAAGMRVAAVSCITNLAAGITGEQLNHAEVVEAGAQAAADFRRLLEASVPLLEQRLG